jgi:hypothetical protein
MYSLRGYSMGFMRTGLVSAGGVPFEVIDGATEAKVKNVLILKGSQDISVNFPARVEIPGNGLTVRRLHFLGGMGGWGYPTNKETSTVATVTVIRTSGQQEEIALRNGVEFADHVTRTDVPGSEHTKGLVYERQVRIFQKTLQGTGPVEKIIIESAVGMTTPAFVAITAEIDR